LASAAGGLWAVGTDDNLYSINASTGAATLIGATGVAATTSTWNSLASGASSLFFDNQDSFYSLNTATGAATFIACEGSLVFGVCSGPQMGAMAAGSGTLYGVHNPSHTIYTLDTGTGHATAGDAISPVPASIYGLSGASATSTSTVPEPGGPFLPAAAVALLGLVRFGYTRRAR